MITNATLDHRIAIERRSQPNVYCERDDTEVAKSCAHHGHRMSK